VNNIWLTSTWNKVHIPEFGKRKYVDERHLLCLKLCACKLVDTGYNVGLLLNLGYGTMVVYVLGKNLFHSL